MPFSEDNSVLEPETEIAEKEVLRISRSKDKSRMFVLLPVEGDHPTLITIDLDTNSYSVGGYD